MVPGFQKSSAITFFYIALYVACACAPSGNVQRYMPKMGEKRISCLPCHYFLLATQTQPAYASLCVLQRARQSCSKCTKLNAQVNGAALCGTHKKCARK